MPRLRAATLCLLFTFTTSTLCSTIRAADDSRPAADSIGRTVESFTLSDYRGREHSLAEYRDADVVVLAFLGTQCPLVKLYGPRLEELSQRYSERGVVILGVNANVHDSLAEMTAYARAHGVTFPILKDAGNRLADTLGAERTPEVFVLDRDRTIRYRGRIDDQYGVGYAREEPSHTGLADAIDALLAGKEIATAVTEVEGCIIGRVRDVQPGGDVTYSNQIARILQQRCVECHRDGEIAPFALTEYDEVAGWAAMIDEVVSENRMPPWHANPAHGNFSNDRRLTADEKQLIARWVAAGAPEGDQRDLPDPVEYTSGWQLPQEPDVVIAMRDKPFDVPPEGVVRYQYFTVDPGFEEDRWVTMAEVVPGNRAVVHHVLVHVRPPKSRESEAAGGGEHLVGYVPGLRARPLPAGMAKLIPAGSKLIFQVHYTPIGTPQQDLTHVGLVFADPADVKHVVVTTRASTGRKLRIPPREENFRTEATTPAAPQDVQLLSLMPHMHLRGKSFRYEARYPDGRTEVLLDVPSYDFNWQTAYLLSAPKTLPAGTRVYTVAHFDNSPHNLNNPNPDVEVGWGDQTWNEMMIGYFDIAVPLPRDARAGAAAAGDATQPGAEVQVGGRAAEALERFDQDQDGAISRDEVPQRLRGLFNRLDADGNGSLSADELTSGLARR
jgi:peroxiredoxin